MKKYSLTDEELLSYLMGDCESELHDQVRSRLKEDPSLRNRVESIAFIKGEIRNTPVLYRLKDRKTFSFRWLARQVALSSVLLVVGILIGSQFETISKSSIEAPNMNVSVSAPLSWDDSKLLSLM